MIKISVSSKDAFDFNAREKLNTDVWEGNVLKDEVREKLLEIAEEFVKFINVELEMDDIKDIIFTGSLANYNYTKFSDIDLHLLINFKDIEISNDNFGKPSIKLKGSTAIFLKKKVKNKM